MLTIICTQINHACICLDFSHLLLYFFLVVVAKEQTRDLNVTALCHGSHLVVVGLTYA